MHMYKEVQQNRRFYISIVCKTQHICTKLIGNGVF